MKLYPCRIETYGIARCLNLLNGVFNQYKKTMFSPASTNTARRGRLQGGKTITIGPSLATTCGPQEFCPAARVRAKGGSYSIANCVPMVSRLYAGCANGESLLRDTRAGY